MADSKNLHRKYYAQFVNEEVKNRVLSFFDRETLLRSYAKDEHFNHKLTPMDIWDLMGGFVWKIRGTFENAEQICVMKPETSEDIKPVDYKLLEATGEGLNNAVMVCIYKEAAKEIIEETEVNK